LLNDDYNARQFQNELKSYLHSILQVDRDFTTEDYENLNPSGHRAINNAMEFIRNPRKMCHEIAGHVERMCDIIRWHKLNNPNRTLYLNETWELAERRWSKELREFRKVNKNGENTYDFDISKIPDIYDNIKYDMEHNPDLCINNEGEFERFYLCVKNMADIVVPQEYGISEESKIRIAQRVCTPLMAKMKNDLHRCVQSPEEDNESLTRLDPRASEGIATPMRHVRTRLYFTSESHIHTLMNLIRYGGLCSPDDKKWQRAMNFLSGVTEFNYMSQVVFMVYEDSRNESEKEGKDRFHIELLFSPGLYPCFQTEKERIYESRFNSTKQKMQNPLNSKSKKHKHNGSSGGASAEASDKETADVEATKKDSISARKDSIVENFTSQRSKSTDSSMIEKTRKIKAKMLLEVSNSPEQGGPLTGESDDDLGSDHAVNLVVLGEITGKQFTADELAMHSPPNLHNRKRHPTGGTKIINNTGSPDEPDNDNQAKFYIPNPIVKSMSLYHHLISPELEENQATVGSGRGKWANELVAETRAAMAKEAVESGNVVSPYASSSGISTKNEDYEDRRPTASAVFTRGDVIVMKRSESSDPNPLSEMPGNASTATIGTTNDEQNYNNVRRSRFPYRFKHHTVNLLTGGSKVENRLISTDVLMGKFMDKKAVLSTAVIARSSSAPRLQTFKTDEEISVNEIRRFWPPLRSLETMHDNVGFKQLDQFLERMMALRECGPSPPKTPRDSQESQASLDRRLKDTIKKLSSIQPQ
uniref:Inositol hexakisphosphate and diphosphoinositol-pentakisphosphate kinase n=1 Tax=Acrobeloides nanus TaxID=290746 RepID=A0A914CHB4_9BILA